MGKSYRVRWTGHALLYETRSHGGHPRCRATLKPTQAEWQRFWQTIDVLGVWAWAEQYCQEDMYDGTSWSLVLEFGGRRLDTGGCNACPPDGARPAESADFQRLCAAVSQLVGGRRFC